MVYREICACLLTHYALSALICKAATTADTDPDRVKFLRTVRLVRRSVTDPAAFPLTSAHGCTRRWHATSQTRATSTRCDHIAATPAWSSAPGTTTTR
jgi:hypothetical protein